MEPRFFVVGAFDRFNYGDLLFPRVAQSLLKKRFPGASFDFYGLSSSDLSAQGGFKTKSMRQLYRNLKEYKGPSVIYIAGGEVLNMGWFNIWTHSTNPFVVQIVRKVLRRIPGVNRDYIVQTAYGSKDKLPYVVHPERFGMDKTCVVYNSVGGTDLPALDQIATWRTEALNKAAFVAVRDHVSLQNLKSLQVEKAKLAPDSAVAMRQMDELSDGSAEHRRKMLDDLIPTRAINDGYICIQMAHKYSVNKTDEIATAIRELHEGLRLHIVLFSIGTAPGHDDHLSVRDISARIGEQDWLHSAPNNISIWQIASLIENARCYAGTSLHGYITAFCFDVPRVGLAKVDKLRRFHETWDLPDMRSNVSFPNLYLAVSSVFAVSKEKMECVRREVETSYLSSFDDLTGQLSEKALYPPFH